MSKRVANRRGPSKNKGRKNYRAKRDKRRLKWEYEQLLQNALAADRAARAAQTRSRPKFLDRVKRLLLGRRSLSG